MSEERSPELTAAIIAATEDNHAAEEVARVQRERDAAIAAVHSRYSRQWAEVTIRRKQTSARFALAMKALDRAEKNAALATEGAP